MFRRVFRILPILLCTGLLIWSCSDDEVQTPTGSEPPPSLASDCIGCHTNEDLLKETALPDEEPEEDPSGEG